MDGLQRAILRAKFCKPLPSQGNVLITDVESRLASVEARITELLISNGRLSSVEAKVNELVQDLSSASKTVRREVVAPPGYLSARETRRILAEFCSTTIGEIDAARQDARSARVRMIGYWLCKKYTQQSLKSIGRIFGGRDHTTILHGADKIERLRLTDEKLAEDLAALEKIIKAAIKSRGQVGEPENNSESRG